MFLILLAIAVSWFFIRKNQKIRNKTEPAKDLYARYSLGGNKTDSDSPIYEQLDDEETGKVSNSVYGEYDAAVDKGEEVGKNPAFTSNEVHSSVEETVSPLYATPHAKESWDTEGRRCSTFKGGND